MSTFSQDKSNAKAAASSVDKDQPGPDDIKNADETITNTGEEIPADDPQKPEEILDESAQETADRHVASTELPAGLVTDPDTQADTAPAQDAAEKIVPGAAVGPEPDGTIRNDHGKPAYAPPGSLNAAFQGVQEDAAGHVDSVGTDNSSKSGSRV